MKRFFNTEPVQPIPAGMYHLQSAPPNRDPYRLHLRMQSNGTGILVLNAATVLQLNPTAAEYAYHLIKGSTPEAAARAVSSRYRVSRKTALKDFQDFAGRVETFISTPDLDPVSYLDFERVGPHTAELTAPLRLDCALTYRLPPGSPGEDAPAKRAARELTTEEWSQILDKAWQVGIPHITFTGGEPTLRDDLPDLIRHAEDLGQVCGLLTDGIRLVERSYLDQLLKSGLDHILHVLQPSREESWRAIGVILPQDIFLTVHLTVTQQNAENAKEILRKLALDGCKSISLTFADSALPASALASECASLGLAMKHDLPVPYSAANPVTLEMASDATPDGAGKVWLYVEPDGDVLPAQGNSSAVLGNFLRDPWENIYRT